MIRSWPALIYICACNVFKKIIDKSKNKVRKNTFGDPLTDLRSEIILSNMFFFFSGLEYKGGDGGGG